jgi:hypothetical protein
MIRFYIGMGIRNTVFYGLFLFLSIFTNAFTDEGKKIIPVLVVVFYVFSLFSTSIYPIIKHIKYK